MAHLYWAMSSNDSKTRRCWIWKVEGILALAVTSHPDFDDTPLWDENNSNYADDGIIFHSHWVVLVRTIASLVAYRSNSSTKPTKLLCFHQSRYANLDSPGFPVLLKGNKLSVLVPAQRIQSKTEFKFDGVVAYMQVNNKISHAWGLSSVQR